MYGIHRYKTLPHRKSARIKENVTYLIVGGLRSGIELVVILLSRSAVSSPHAQLLRKDPNVLGVNVAVRNCDIADLASLLSKCLLCGHYPQSVWALSTIEISLC